MERDGENKVANETGEAMMVRRGSGGREGELRGGDKVNSVPNHCQAVGIRAEQRSINLN